MIQQRQPTLSSVRRDAWVEVDLAAIEKNLAIVTSFLTADNKVNSENLPNSSTKTKIMAVVKSDAYGHGSLPVAEMLVALGVDWLGVASVDEACQLRALESKPPILILGPAPSWAVKTAIEADLNMTVTSLTELKDISATATRMKRAAQVNIKVDTGMHRLGVLPGSLIEMLDVVKCDHNLKLVSIFSHLAMAADPDATAQQNSVFNECIRKARSYIKEPFITHMASSDAVKAFPDTHCDMVRVGIHLYGLEAKKDSDFLHPAMSVRARINHTQEIEAGESAGYNYTWTAKRPSRLASIPIGYADGVDRGLSNRMTCLLMGKTIPQVGIISMDQMLVDITDVPQAQEGDVITLIGSEQGQGAFVDGKTSSLPTLSLATWAGMLDTITYELACRLRVRLPRIYTRHRAAPFTTGDK
ncbi:MAG: alanine racemase [Leptolyngbya sp.]|nr:alanine racemase [Candidatus Melainabacteria bacterium]